MHQAFLAIILPLFLIGCTTEKEPLGPPFNIGARAVSAVLYQNLGPDFRKITTPTFEVSPNVLTQSALSLKMKEQKTGEVF